jgi:hypothetical protein
MHGIETRTSAQTTSLTETTSSPQELVLTLTGTQSPQDLFTAVMSALDQIRARHQGENDTLSQDLKDWIKRFSTFVARENPATLEEVERLGRRELELLKDLLRNPLAPDRIVDSALFDGEYIWDETTLNDYLQLYHISPFNSRTRIEAHPHPFCREVIAWWKSLPLDAFSQTAPVTSRELILRNFSSPTPPILRISSQNAATKLELYLLHAQQAVSAKRARDQQKMIERLSVSLTTTVVRAEAGIREAVNEMRQSNAAHHREANMRMDANDQLLRTTQTIFNGAIRDRDQRIHAQDVRQQQSEAEIAELKRQDAANKAQLAAQAQTIASLSNRGGGGGGRRCTIL